ncbi:MAG: L-rhamnose mutarotase [Clostridiales bacterium]|nr:L-rhamnose mutarotase [Clostridiales bacterium]
MIRRFCQRAFLKPEKIEEYRKLHAEPWPGVLKTISDCNLQNYSIAIMGNMVVSYFEYTGDDYEADMAKMDADPITLEWWTHTKPCFLRHDEGVYYEDLEEIFYYN